jgi:hypothetical protein
MIPQKAKKGVIERQKQIEIDPWQILRLNRYIIRYSQTVGRKSHQRSHALFNF